MESLLKRVPSPAPRQVPPPNGVPVRGKLPNHNVSEAQASPGATIASPPLSLLGNSWTITNLPERLTAALKQRNWNSAQRKQLTDVISAAKVFREETLRNSCPKNSEHFMLEEAVLQRGIIRSDLDLPPRHASMTLARMFKHHRIPPKYMQRIIDEATPGGGDGFMRLLEGIATRQQTNVNGMTSLTRATRTGSPDEFKRGKDEAVVRWTDDDDGMCVLTVDELGSLSHLFGIQPDDETSLPLDLRATSPQSPSRALSTPQRSSSRSFHYKNLDAADFDSQSNVDNNDSASMASRRGTLIATGAPPSPTAHEFTSSRQSGLGGRTAPSTLRHELMFAKAEALISGSRELFNTTEASDAYEASRQSTLFHSQQTHHHHHTIGEMSHHHPQRKSVLSPVPLAPSRNALCDSKITSDEWVVTSPSPNSKLRAVTETRIRQESLRELKRISEEKSKLLARKRMSKLMKPLTLSEAAESAYRPIPEAERERCDRAWQYNDEYWFLDEEKFRQEAQAAQLQREGSTATSATRERRDPDVPGETVCSGRAPLRNRPPDDDEIVWTMSGPQYRTEAERMFLAVQRTKASAHVRAQEIASKTRGEILTVKSSGAQLFRSGSPQAKKTESPVHRSPTRRVSPVLRGRLAELSVPRVLSPPPLGEISTAEDFQNRRERDAALRRASEESARHVAIPVFLNIRAFA